MSTANSNCEAKSTRKLKLVATPRADLSGWSDAELKGEIKRRYKVAKADVRRIGRMVKMCK